MVQLRDIDTSDNELSDFLIKEGFVKVAMPEAHVIDNLKWNTTADYISQLSLNARKNLKKTVLKTEQNFQVHLRKSADMDDRSIAHGSSQISSDEIDYWYQLYLNVKQDSFALNTFTIPKKLFINLLHHPNWDIFELKLKDDVEARPVAVVFCYRSSKKAYSPFVIGLDYNYVLTHGCYRQGMFQSILRANRLKCDKVYLGMDASVEKKKFGAEVIEKSVFVQADDNFNMELIEAIYNNARQ